MKTVIEILTDKVSEAFEACGYSKELGAVKVSDRPDLCQFQCNGAFSGAKLYKKAPMIIAKEVTEKLQGDSIFTNLLVVGAGFINIDVNDTFLLDYMAYILSDEHLGIKQTTKNETIFLDYGGPNAAKSLHVGHLRSAIIGESLKRLANATGRKTVSDVHLGDWGLQMGLVMAELEERGDYSLSGEEWSNIYPLASQKSKENEAFKQKAQDITAKFQMEDPKYYTLWKKIMEISVGSGSQTVAETDEFIPRLQKRFFQQDWNCFYQIIFCHLYFLIHFFIKRKTAISMHCSLRSMIPSLNEISFHVPSGSRFSTFLISAGKLANGIFSTESSPKLTNTAQLLPRSLKSPT